MLEMVKVFILSRLPGKDEEGQTLVEYALLLVLIAIVVIVMLTGVGQQVCNVFSDVNSALTPASGT